MATQRNPISKNKTKNKQTKIVIQANLPLVLRLKKKRTVKLNDSHKAVLKAYRTQGKDQYPHLDKVYIAVVKFKLWDAFLEIKIQFSL